MSKQHDDVYVSIEEMRIKATDLPKYCRTLLEANFDPEIILNSITAALDLVLGRNCRDEENFDARNFNNVVREFIPYLNPSQLLEIISLCLPGEGYGYAKDFVSFYKDGLIARPNDGLQSLNYTLHPAEYFLACVAYRADYTYRNFDNLLNEFSIKADDLLSHIDSKWIDNIIYCLDDDSRMFYDSLVENELESLSQPSVRLTKFMEYFVSAGGNLENFALIFTKNFDPDINSYFRANKKDYIKALRQALLDAGVGKKIVAQI